MVDNRGRMRFDTVSGFFIMIRIYKITSPSGKVYIGQSIDIERRWKKYKKLDCKGQPKLYRSFNKYGVDAHKFEIITTCYIEELDELERYYQEAFNVLKSGLNCVYQDTSTRRGGRSEETLAKMSKATKGKNNPRYTRVKSYNIKTKEILIMGMKETISHFNINLKTLRERLNFHIMHNNKLKDWEFTYVDKEKQKMPKLVNRDIYLDVLTGVYYYSLNEVAEYLKDRITHISYYKKLDKENPFNERFISVK